MLMFALLPARPSRRSTQCQRSPSENHGAGSVLPSSVPPFRCPCVVILIESRLARLAGDENAGTGLGCVKTPAPAARRCMSFYTARVNRFDKPAERAQCLLHLKSVQTWASQRNVATADYAGSGLARLYDTACRRLTTRQTRMV